MSIRTLIYEDNELLRESIVGMVGTNAELKLVGSFDNAVVIKEQMEDTLPDLILMDIEMPGITGIEATKIARRFMPEVAIIILTVFEDSENVLNAIKAGASGYLLKKHISARLFDAIDEVMRGGAPLSPAVARLVLQSMHKPADDNPYKLTQREKEILLSLSQGNSYKMIAADFGISIDTVRTHIKKIYEKLHVHSQTEAVSKAINEGLV
ncbi:MAG: DNA-binding response regulator [Bacteroidetes bacterium]|nr:MAG: DNA-binding response regulator [Bacteroidota bacterium]